MGLDMYLYRIRRLSDEERKEADKIKDENELQARFHAVELEDDDEFASIRGYIHVVTLKVKRLLYVDVKKALGIPEDAKRQCAFFGGEKFDETWIGKDGKEYHITNENLTPELRSNLERTVKRKFGLWHEEEIGYWRKEYDLQESLHLAADGDIGNCEYAPLNSEMRRILRRKKWGGFTKEQLADTDDSTVCYYEWY